MKARLFGGLLFLRLLTLCLRWFVRLWRRIQHTPQYGIQLTASLVIS